MTESTMRSNSSTSSEAPDDLNGLNELNKERGTELGGFDAVP